MKELELQVSHLKSQLENPSTIQKPVTLSTVSPSPEKVSQAPATEEKVFQIKETSLPEVCPLSICTHCHKELEIESTVTPIESSISNIIPAPSSLKRKKEKGEKSSKKKIKVTNNSNTLGLQHGMHFLLVRYSTKSCSCK